MGGAAPETTAAKALGAIGTLTGFVVGAPMKIVGKGAVKAGAAVGRGLSKTKSTQTLVKEAVENISEDSLRKSAFKVAPNVTNQVKHLNRQASWDANIATKWGDKVEKAL